MRSFAQTIASGSSAINAGAGRIARIEADDEPRRDFGAVHVQRLAVAGEACVNRRRRVAKTRERDAPRAQLEQMLGHAIAGAAIVDADEIVLIAMAVRTRAPIQQHDRNAGLVEAPP